MRLTAMILGLAVNLALVARTDGQSTVYQLVEASSSYIFGCYPPCLCPIFATNDLQGTFVLTFTGFDGTYDQYDVSAVDWSASAGAILISGSGSYRRTVATPLLQELTLDLVIDGTPHTVTSGVVAVVQFPNIEVAAAENGFFCFDYVVSFTAVPAGPAPQNFMRGDCNVDSAVNIADVIFGLDVLFGAGSSPPCEDSCDGNDDGAFNIADMVAILNYLFVGGALPEPLLCGPDLDFDMLQCGSSPCP
ncbi:MAG: hypothetical protein AB7O52_19500 [Planctomycetota bacterium]